MSERQSELLLKKIGSARFDIATYPLLETVANRLGKVCSTHISSALGVTQIQAVNSVAAAKESPRAFEEAEGARALYLVRVSPRQEAIFVSIKNPFAAIIGEVMLGGALAFDGGGNNPSRVDIEVAGSVINSIVEDLVLIEAAKAPIESPRVIELSENEVKATYKKTFCNLSFDLALDDDRISEAICFHFPLEYLEGLGLLAKGRSRDIDLTELSQWRCMMRDNVEGSSLELNIVLDAYKAPLSELANLEVGQVISLSENSEKSCNVMLPTASGPCLIAAGRLGAYKEFKALKLSTDVDPEQFARAM